MALNVDALKVQHFDTESKGSGTYQERYQNHCQSKISLSLDELITFLNFSAEEYIALLFDVCRDEDGKASIKLFFEVRLLISSFIKYNNEPMHYEY